MGKRKTNFDLLRIFAMYGIIIYHHFAKKTLNYIVELSGGFTKDSYFYDFVNNMHLARGHVSKVSLLMDFCYGHFGHGGNFIFMIITGYFLFGREISFPKRVRTVARILYAILFYGILLTLINFFVLVRFWPFSSYKTFYPIFTLPNWLSEYNMWYLQAYGCFVLLILPILKKFESRLTQKTHLCLILTLAFLRLLAYDTFFPNLWISTRILHFILFYYLGGYISKYKPSIKLKTLLIFFFSYLLIYFAYEYYWRYSCSVMYKPSKYSYVEVMSPYICTLIYAVLCFLIFNCIKVPQAFSNIIGSISDKTIGIYILHFNLLDITFIMADYLGWHNWSRKGYFLFVIIDSLALFVIGFFVDIVRKWSYKLIEQKVIKSFS